MEFLAERRTIRAGTTVAFDDLGSFDTSSVTANSSGRSAVELLLQAEAMRAEAVRRLVPFDSADCSIMHGYATPARHLSCEAGLADDDAKTMISITRLCARYELTAKALAEGVLPLSHAAVLAKAAHGLGDFYAEDEARLLGLVDGREEGAFRRALQNWRHNRLHRADRDDGTSDAFANRHVVSQRAFDGSGKGNFGLDAEGMDMLEDALFTKPDPADGPVPQRTKAQRQADALVDMAADFNGTPRRNIADHDEAASNAGTADKSGWSPEPTGARTSKPSNVDVIIDLQTLENQHHDDIAAIRAEFASGHAAPIPILDKILCDATFRRVLMDGPSTILDYGKPLADIPRHLRKVVQIRDRCCQMPGCDRSWQWCDVHHVKPKSRGGPDSTDNLILLCRFHHGLVHKAGWRVERDPVTGHTRAWSP